MASSTRDLIPPEVVDIIIDHLHNDPSTLLACALVARAWLPTSCYHYFSATTVASRHYLSQHNDHSKLHFQGHIQLWDGFIHDIQEKPSIGSLITTLQIGATKSNEVDKQRRYMPLYCGDILTILRDHDALPRLHVLHLEAVRVLQDPQPHMSSSQRRTLDRLTLQSIEFMPLQILAGFLPRMFECLDSIALFEAGDFYSHTLSPIVFDWSTHIPAISAIQFISFGRTAHEDLQAVVIPIVQGSSQEAIHSVHFSAFMTRDMYSVQLWLTTLPNLTDLTMDVGLVVLLFGIVVNETLGEAAQQHLPEQTGGDHRLLKRLIEEKKRK